MARNGGKPSEDEIAAVVSGSHTDPFSLLGIHHTPKGWVARAFLPGATRVAATRIDGTPLGELDRRHAEGFFEGRLDVKDRLIPRYLASNAEGAWQVVDPYAFGPVLGPMDDYYAAEGTHLRLYDRLGAHLMEHEGVAGVHFALWAPNAHRVSIVGDFNAWDGRRHVMRRRPGSGMWEMFLPGIGEGAAYKYEIVGADRRLVPLKADPFAFYSEKPPRTASIVARTDGFAWTDADYLARRAGRNHRRAPVSIYEVHLGSWRRRPDGAYLTYDELAAELVPYAKNLGFTHIELLPVSEHPFDPSWGYQPTGLFAPTSRFGTPDAFQRFVDAAHAADLGIILDWVPAHFPTDEHGLSRFDGTALYEHDDPRRGFHPDWNTAIYNFGRREVASYLINNALFWFERYHVDGLRVDAVASMLYLDYSRKEGEWLPNEQGGRENTDAIRFLQRMNEVAYGTQPGVMTIAEESTAWPGVSQPVYGGGLGFGFKWNMGFMHDTLLYLGRDHVHRRFHHNEITFGLLYAFSENFVLPLSHDEVVHGKGSLLSKMAGDDWQKFAGLRAYYGFMWAYPGKKLLFMGQEFAQRREWSHASGLDWELLDAPWHAGIRALIGDLNRLYANLPALHARDCEPDGFQWLVAEDADQSVFAWIRRAEAADRPVAVVTNFTPVPRPAFRLPLPLPGRWRELINTDGLSYGGTGMGNFGEVRAGRDPWFGQPASAQLTLPPLATLILEYVGD